MRSSDPIRALARDMSQAAYRTDEALQATTQAIAQSIEGSARTPNTTPIVTSFGDGAAVTGPGVDQVDVGDISSQVAAAAASTGAQKILGL